jgi:predicted RNase H-like HicB family nuclease
VLDGVDFDETIQSCYPNHQGGFNMPLTIEFEQEDDGRWLAEVPDISGVLAYGETREEAIERVQALSLRVLADRLDHGEPVPQMNSVFAVTP